ncbi:uncharacterized protein Z518_09337 [Rhinocladiella mackenziei CBS 650.93]|uniref:Acyltransferase 3 domain-containing protein n=1 Tax=Rhinocladiella mackenziei CBS 650.93 TaxID=1442369 RepID=A0A0D2IEE0_9EURO|nr:uncharacterized protein Z518_09337 [Rhinocladiella mackenziei CBS 650.93]KIX01611.1 hypothetical protein Z518_09337 [Rhinocladiella mackenziei CBS 650.93]
MDSVKDALKKAASFRLSPRAKEHAMKDTTFVDGLRGIAAVLVVSSHIVLCYARELIPPCCAPNSETPYLFQRPIFRLVASGHSWVAVFFILMGFVNALKPIQLARAGQIEKALTKLASSSFSRIFRLVLPATAATIISWFICNIDLYRISSSSDAFWLKSNTPGASPSWTQALRDLLAGLKATWVFGDENPYDQPQWALVYLLQGSVMIISALTLVISMIPLWRTVTLFILAFWSLNWSWTIGDPWTGLCCFLGVALGELSLSDFPNAVASVSPYLSPPIILISLVMMSYPSSFSDRASWSKWFHEFGIRFLPVDYTASLDRMYGSLGGLLLMVGILISPHARWALSSRPLIWLGKVSFAIYLLHGMIVRTIFAWILHFGHPKELIPESTQNGAEYHVERYPVPGFSQRAFATIILALCVGAASHEWTMKMEPLFAKITTKLEGLVTGKFYIELKSKETRTPGVSQSSRIAKASAIGKRSISQNEDRTGIYAPIFIVVGDLPRFARNLSNSQQIQKRAVKVNSSQQRRRSLRLQTANHIQTRPSPPSSEARVEYWTNNGTWPTEGQEKTMDRFRDIVNHALARKRSGSLSRKRSNTSSQQPRDQKSSPYRHPLFEDQLKECGSFMDDYEGGITAQSEELCQTLLKAPQPSPEHTLFSDNNLFKKTCKITRGEDGTKVGASHLEILRENTNVCWVHAIPFIKPPDSRPAPPTYNMFFHCSPAKSNAKQLGLDIADRRNAHSQSVILRDLTPLFRLAGWEDELHQEINGFCPERLRFVASKESALSSTRYPLNLNFDVSNQSEPRFRDQKMASPRSGPSQ